MSNSFVVTPLLLTIAALLLTRLVPFIRRRKVEGGVSTPTLSPTALQQPFLFDSSIMYMNPDIKRIVDEVADVDEAAQDAVDAQTIKCPENREHFLAKGYRAEVRGRLYHKVSPLDWLCVVFPSF